MTRSIHLVSRHDAQRSSETPFQAPVRSVETLKVHPQDLVLAALSDLASDSVRQILQQEFSDSLDTTPPPLNQDDGIFPASGMTGKDLEKIDLYGCMPVQLRIEIAEYISYPHSPEDWKVFSNTISETLLKRPAYLDYRDIQAQEPVSLDVFLKHHTQFTLQLPEYAAKISDLLRKIQEEFLPSGE